MSGDQDLTITVSSHEVYLLLEALDVYEYWQLGDVLPRNNGAVFLPDDPFAHRFWDPDQAVTPEQGEAIGEARACRALAFKLHQAST